VTGFGRLLADLNRAGVRYLVVGGIAVRRTDLEDLNRLETAHGTLPKPPTD
jgi:hypothetical protein